MSPELRRPILLAVPVKIFSERAVDPLIILGLATGVVGIAWVAFGRGAALRLQVQVGGSDKATGDLLLSRLGALGAERPNGLEVAGASDVSELPESALTTVPEGTWAQLLFNILRVVRPSTPWHVTATFPDTDCITWSIARNGIATVKGMRIATAAEIPAGPEKEKPGAVDTKDELLTACAADVLVTLAEVHPRLAWGLCGAREGGWRALALHAIAVRQSTGAGRRCVLLETSIDASSTYALPRLAYLKTYGHDKPEERKKTAEKSLELKKLDLGLDKKAIDRQQRLASFTEDTKCWGSRSKGSYRSTPRDTGTCVADTKRTTCGCCTTSPSRG